jgi:Phage terminase, small subunit
VENRLDRVAELRRRGLSYRAIGRELGISHEQARQDHLATGRVVLAPVPDVPVTPAKTSSSRGQAFRTHVLDTFNLDQAELELLEQVCRLLDHADALQAAIEADGVMVTTSQGDRRPNPAIAVARSTSLAIGRLLGQLAIPSEHGEAVPTPAQVQARKAARSRWDQPWRQGRRSGRGT